MGCCNEPATALASAAPLPNKHVNFAKGMVLGVDDFRQEFAYHAGRDRWLARDAIGYGRLAGLDVTIDDTPDGPRLKVSSGSALAPSGQLICVTADQCALFSRWLAKPENASQIDAIAGGSPPASSVSLYLTLCYADCQTDNVPIPGEPCRSEDELMAPSRIADDYRLELRTEAPAQREEDALRDFVQWLHGVVVVDTSPPLPLDEAALLAALRDAAQPWIDALTLSPPASPSSPPSLTDYLYGSPNGFSVSSSQLPELLRVAFRFWVTTLRPLWQACCCACVPAASDDCLLLARIDLPVIQSGGVWLVDSGADPLIDTAQAPYLISQRLLQEWLLSSWSVAAAQPSPPPAPGGVSIAVTATNTDLALGDAHHCLICSGPLTLTLPAAADEPGRVYIVKSLVAATTLATAGADTLDLTPTPTVAAGTAVTLVSDGATGWWVIGRA